MMRLLLDDAELAFALHLEVTLRFFEVDLEVDFADFLEGLAADFTVVACAGFGLRATETCAETDRAMKTSTKRNISLFID